MIRWSYYTDSGIVIIGKTDLFNQYNFNYDYQESSPGSSSNEVNGVGWTILGRFYWGCKWIIREQA